jgi:diguanylate cyclase (GGDEF)-like protein
MKTLIVEDSSSYLKVLSLQAERAGFTPLPASSGSAGVELFDSERPDLVLLDIVLPDIDGFEVARRIRQLERPGDWTPIIFLTALDGDKHLEKGIAAGGDDYLYKPVSETVLAAKMRAMQRILQMRQSLLVVTRKLDAANQELRRLSALDGLTGVANRRHFDAMLDREWRRAQRQGSALSILMCDIDYFKSYNDRYGHLQGDECLRQLARTLQQGLDRGGDLLARYGGEEFVALLPDTGPEGAAFVAERLRLALAELRLAHEGSPFGEVTASFGVASGLPAAGSDGQALLAAADRALYAAKQAGRNRVAGQAGGRRTENGVPS